MRKNPITITKPSKKVYDTTSPCRECAHCKTNHPDGLAHCVYRMYGFDPDQVIICGDKKTKYQK